MELPDLFWNATLEELKEGFIQTDHSYRCLLCGESIEKGLVYQKDNVFYEAERYMRVHIESVHESVFKHLIRLDRKLTGLTEHQRKLLELFYEGRTDREVQDALDIGSASTIRHHRFALKEKERQAKTFLAMMELLKEKDENAPSFISVPPTAKLVDKRYDLTKSEYDESILKYFKDGRLTKFPLKEKQRMIVIREIAKSIEDDKTYDEKGLNALLGSFYEDYVLIRRYLIEYGLLDRKTDGSAYWLKK